MYIESYQINKSFIFKKAENSVRKERILCSFVQLINTSLEATPNGRNTPKKEQIMAPNIVFHPSIFFFLFSSPVFPASF